MATFKCKMCGGELNIHDHESVAVCEYCGTKQTVPNLDDEKRATLYERANHFRRENEFDKAMAVYESILEDDKEDCEAYWGLVLCKYGIEYVEDPQSHKRVPTVNRAQYTSVFVDEDYQSAIKYADGYQRDIYEAEASVIDVIQKGILDISSKEEPFDVFICYKESDNKGLRTQDSVYAQNIYKNLTAEGYKVFFARITLEDKLGTAYEPYIFAALNSAKVMITIGTNKDNFEAVWVRNEWSRFLSLMKKDKDKTLIPVYKDMDPYDLPQEFAYLQAQDMNKVGFMQDLLHGVQKIVSKDELDSRQKAGTTNVILDTNIARATEALADGEWKAAYRSFNNIVDYDYKNTDAYVGMLLATLHIKNKSDLANVDTDFENDINYQKALKYGDDNLRKELEGYCKSVQQSLNKNKKTVKRTKSFSCGLIAITQISLTFILGYIDLNFISHNGIYVPYICPFVLFGFILFVIPAIFAKKKKVRIFFTVLTTIAAFVMTGLTVDLSYHFLIYPVEENREMLGTVAIILILAILIGLIPAIITISFNAIKNKSNTKAPKILGVLMIVAVMICPAFFLVNNVIAPNIEYNQAVSLMKKGDYEKAITKFLNTDYYKDDNEEIKKLKYETAQKLEAEGNGSLAAAYYLNVGDYNDALQKANGYYHTALNRKYITYFDDHSDTLLCVRNDDTIGYITNDSDFRASAYLTKQKDVVQYFDHKILCKNGIAYCNIWNSYGVNYPNLNNIVGISSSGDFVRSDGMVLDSDDGIYKYSKHNYVDPVTIVLNLEDYYAPKEQNQFVQEVMNRYSVYLNNDGTFNVIYDEEYGTDNFDDYDWKMVNRIKSLKNIKKAYELDSTIICLDTNGNLFPLASDEMYTFNYRKYTQYEPLNMSNVNDFYKVYSDSRDEYIVIIKNDGSVQTIYFGNKKNPEPLEMYNFDSIKMS